MFNITRKHSSNKTLRFPEELSLRIEILAGQNKTTFSNVVFQACEYALKSLEKKELNLHDSNVPTKIKENP